MAGESERVVRRLYDAFNGGGSADELMADLEPLLHPDVEYVNPPDAMEPGTRRGPDGWRGVVESMRQGLGPAATAELEELRERGDLVFVRASLRTGGTASGVEVGGPALGALFTVQDGLVRRFEWRWNAEDALAIFERDGGAG